MSKKKPKKSNARGRNEIDVIISKRMHLLRREKGKSLIWLAARIDVTYQQLQKYETAVNRVPASRLFLISLALDVPLDYFYYGAKAAAKRMVI